MRFTFASVCVLAVASAASAQSAKVLTPPKSNPNVQAAAGTTTTPITPVTTGTSFLVGGTYDCVAADPITGTGSFAVNTTGATTNTQQSGSCANANNDVWFSWTAPSTGIATLATCGGVSVDSVVAAYNGAGCPTGANLLSCNDDFCGLQSQITFPVTGGSVYTLQLGAFGTTTTYSGTFTLNISVPAGNDACTAPVVISGLGPHNFDNTAATTGAEGQAEAICNFFGSTAIAHDLWFSWTAPSTGTFSLSSCSQTTVDTKFAVYNGAGCPTSAAIACNDDACGLQTGLCFNATSGQTYSIQIGTYPFANGGAGTFTFAAAGTTGPCQPLDDGTTENSVGLTAGGEMAWMVGYGDAGGGPTTVSAIQTCYGTPLFPGGTPPAGTAIRAVVWEDTDNDGNAATGLTVASVTNATIAAGSIDTDVFQTIPITPTTVNGFFWVGITLAHVAGQFPGPPHQSAGGSLCGGGGAGGSYVVGNTAGPLDINNLNANNVPPQSMTSVGLPGNWLLRITCGPSTPGTGYCFGDGTGTACPCGNNGAAGHGCANSFPALGGALLTAIGNAQVSADTVQLQGSSMPNASVLYFQGTAQVSTVFGDGLRCAGGTVIRLGTKTNVANSSGYGFGLGDIPIHTRGSIPAAGATRNYQAWYRNAAAFCTPFAFNLFNGFQIIWTP